MSFFKDFPGLENLEKKFKDFQGPALIPGFSNARTLLYRSLCLCLGSILHTMPNLQELCQSRSAKLEPKVTP